MKKNYIAGLLIIATGFIASGTCLISPQLSNGLLANNTNQNNNVIVFDNSKNTTVSNLGFKTIVKTTTFKNNVINLFSASNLIKPNALLTFKPGASIYNKIGEDGRIKGLTSINVSFVSNVNPTIDYGWDDTLLSEDGWFNSSVDSYSVSNVSIENNISYNFNNECPSYFRITAKDNLTISKISITYTCIETTNPHVKGDYEYVEDSNGLNITKYTGNDIDVVIPSIIDNKKVYSVKPDAFRNTNVHSIIINEGLEVLEGNAFSGMPKLEYLTIANSVKSITGTLVTGADASLKIYCEINTTGRPSGYKRYWNNPYKVTYNKGRDHNYLYQVDELGNAINVTDLSGNPVTTKPKTLNNRHVL